MDFRGGAVILGGGPGSVESHRGGAVMTDDVSMNRCYWRSRRGLLELDLLLPPFVRANFDVLTSSERQALCELLEHDDHDIWDWLRGASDPAASLTDIVARIRAFNDERAGARGQSGRLD